MNRIKTCLVVFIIIFSMAFSSHSFAQDEDFSELLDVQEDIRIINLLNSLDLKREQIASITRQAELAKAVYDNSIREIRSRSSRLAGLSRTIKEEVEEGKVSVGHPVAKEFHVIKDEIKSIKRDMHTKIDSIASDVERELEPFQLIALDNYRPCVIPIAANGRIGQADSSKGIGKLLQRVKDMPAGRYGAKREEIVSRFLEKIKGKLPHNMQIDESEAERKLINAFTTVRAMDDAEFQIKKETLAVELEENMLPAKREMQRKTKIKKFLLSKNAIPILRERSNAVE